MGHDTSGHDTQTRDTPIRLRPASSPRRRVCAADLARVGASCDITCGLGSVAYQRLLRDSPESPEAWAQTFRKRARPASDSE